MARYKKRQVSFLTKFSWLKSSYRDYKFFRDNEDILPRYMMLEQVKRINEQEQFSLTRYFLLKTVKLNRIKLVEQSLKCKKR